MKNINNALEIIRLEQVKEFMKNGYSEKYTEMGRIISFPDQDKIELFNLRHMAEDVREAMSIYADSVGGSALNMVEIVEELVTARNASAELLSHATAMANECDGAIEAFKARDHMPEYPWGTAIPV